MKQWRQECPPAGNRRRCTIHGITYPGGGEYPLLTWLGGPHLTWLGGTPPHLAGGVPLILIWLGGGVPHLTWPRTSPSTDARL